MNRYKVLWDKDALKDLKQLDRKIARKIIQKVSSYLAVDPVHLGKPLSGNLSGLMRYRFGDYRVIYEIDNTKIVVMVIKIGHRKDVYNSN